MSEKRFGTALETKGAEDLNPGEMWSELGNGSATERAETTAGILKACLDAANGQGDAENGRAAWEEFANRAE